MATQRPNHKYTEVTHKEFDRTICAINHNVEEVKKSIEGVQNTLNNIQVNGRMGLQEALQDIYHRIGEVEQARNSAFLNRRIGDILFGKTILTKVFWTITLYIVVNTMLHALGVSLDLSSIGTFIKGTP